MQPNSFRMFLGSFAEVSGNDTRDTEERTESNI